jgi:hypothetical protein
MGVYKCGASAMKHIFDLRSICFALAVILSFLAPPAAFGAGEHAFRDACQAIYGSGNITAISDKTGYSPRADLSLAIPTAKHDTAVGGPEKRSGNGEKKKTVDALIYATTLLVGIMDDSTCELYERVLAKIHGLELSSLDISDLSPLASMQQLEELTLSNDNIVDLTPLKNCKKLISLDISGNAVVDLTPLHELDNLVDLRALKNHINDVSQLSGLPHLENVYLSANQIVNVDALAGSPIRFVVLNNNKISVFPALSTAKTLRMLDLNGNLIDSLATFPKPPITFRVDISNNPIPWDDVNKIMGSLGLDHVVSFADPYKVPELPGVGESSAYINVKPTIVACPIVDRFMGNWPTCRETQYAH